MVALSVCEAQAPPNAWPRFRCRGVFVFSGHGGAPGERRGRGGRHLAAGGCRVLGQAFFSAACDVADRRSGLGRWVGRLPWLEGLSGYLKNWPLRMGFWFLLEEFKVPFHTRYGAQIRRWPRDTLMS